MKFNCLEYISPTTILWIIFSFLFFFFTYKEYKQSLKGLKVKELNLGFSDLNEAYNTTRKAIIESDKASHKTAAISFLLAGLTALASLFLSL